MELYVESEARLSFLDEVGKYLSPQQELHSLNKVRQKLKEITTTVDSNLQGKSKKVRVIES